MKVGAGIDGGVYHFGVEVVELRRGAVLGSGGDGGQQEDEEELVHGLVLRFGDFWGRAKFSILIALCASVG